MLRYRFNRRVMFYYATIIIIIYIIFYIFRKKVTHITKLSPLEKYNLVKDKWCGVKMFSFLVGYYSPFSNVTNPLVISYNEKECKVLMKDNQKNYNCFNSVHAIAMSNIGELSIGLVILEYINNKNKNSTIYKYRGIITNIECIYYKKTRGDIIAISNIEDMANNNLIASLYNTQGKIICNVSTTWNISKERL